MSLIRRTKMISFRVSADEFTRLRAISEMYGARSVSDYAREKLSCCEDRADRQIDHQLEELVTLMQHVSRSMNRLFELVREDGDGTGPASRRRVG